jgi:predicted homoserine dehydrogenase-like protein
VTRQENLLPLGLAPGSRLRNDIPLGTPLTYADVELDNSLTILHLRRLQDQQVQSANGK